MLNKILLRKIKFPLSLRGAFFFCHSRLSAVPACLRAYLSACVHAQAGTHRQAQAGESGNPSSMSLREVFPHVIARERSNRSNLTLSGFSLIELMVAVVILAIAVLGIFLAFSNAWMGMANARDRTVATNYAREAMEDVKNMDFELVTNENLGTAESVGAKFTRVIFVNTESDNLKKIDTKVFWTNRQGQYVSVEPSMYINRTLLNPGAASRITLYADPYYTVLPTAGTANIIAVIKDIDGNIKIDWTGGNIRFLIIEGTDYGFLPVGAYVPGVEPTKGRADTIFTGSAEGDVVIKASVDLPNGGGTVSDTITIRVTLDVVRIKLSAVPDKIKADGTNISTVTAELVNSGDKTVVEALNKITFAIDISGKGSFVDSEGTPLGSTTVIRDPELGVAIIYVKSIDNIPGVATVTASSDGLISGTVNIIITGVATSIFVSVEPDLIYIDDTDGARVTVEIQDINGNQAEYTSTINLSISVGTGNFADNPVGPDTTPKAYSTLFHPSSLGLITITASGEGLTGGSATINVQAALIADTITIKADPKNILAGGDAVSVITATIKQGSTVISNYNNPVIFEIVSDTSTSKSARFSDNTTYIYLIGADYGNDGVAVVNLKSAIEVGICTIKVSTVNSESITINNTVKVGFYSGEDHIELKAFPSKMLVEGDTCTVMATVVDEGGIPVVNYNEDITFTILVGWPKNVKFAATGTSSLTTTLTDGDIDIYLIPQKEAGTVTLKASSFTGTTNITGYLNIQVITALTDLELALEPHIIYDEDQVSFDINVQGADLFLNEMQVSWSPDDSETLNTIVIRGNEVYSNVTGVVSGIVVDTVATLPTGISNVKLYFNESMSGKTLEVIFNATSGNYPVEISELLIE